MSFALRKIYWVLLLIGIGLVLVYGFRNFYMDFMFVFSSIFRPLIAGATVIASMFALREYWERLSNIFTRIWLYFVHGLIFWFLGELAWGTHILVFGVEIPYPSIADAFWLIGYIPLFLALTSYLWLVRPAISKRILTLTIVTVFSIAVVYWLIFVIPTVLSEADAVTRIVDVAYPSLTLLLFALSILGLMVFSTTRLKGKLDEVWILLNAGVLMRVIAVSSFCYTTAQGIFCQGHPLELFYFIGYLLFTVAFYLHIKELQEKKN
jgi:hypothetical protein